MSQPLRKEMEVFLPLSGEQAPKTRTRRRRAFSLSRSRLPVVVAVLLVGYLALSLGSQFNRLSTMQKDIVGIEQEVQELKQRNTTLREELRLVQSEAFVEKTAREKLGLVKPGETRVVPVPQGAQLKRIEPPDPTNTVSD